MSNLEALRERFAETGWRVFERAVRECQQDGTGHVAVEHVLLALAGDGSDLFQAVMGRLRVDPGEVVDLLGERRAKVPRHDGGGVRISAEATGVFRLALARARADRRGRIEAADLLVSLSQDSSGPLSQVLGSLNVSQESLVNAALDCARANQRPARRESRVVRIKSGPYASFTGRVEGDSEDRATVKVAVTAFGRTTVLELRPEDVEEVTFIKR